MTQPMNKIPKSSEAFITMEYQIQQILNAPRVQIIEAFDINNVQQAVNFGKFCETLQPLNVVHAFIPTTSFQQPLSDIIKNGVRISPNLPLHVCPNKIKVNKDRDFNEVIHVLVALGNTYNYQPVICDQLDKAEFIQMEPKAEELPEDYDSLCVNESDFVIFQPEQIRTLHIVRFTSGETLELKHETDHKCSLCGEPATIWCTNCAAKLCEKCEQESHNGNKLLENHKRVPISDAYTQMTDCPFHPGVKVEHFCFQCQLPVCLECKMSGTHSFGSASKHTLVPLRDAYTAACKHTETEDRIYIRRRKALNEKKDDLTKRLKDVIQNQKTVEARIMKVAEDAIFSLRQQSGERAIKLRSALSEIDRKLKEIVEREEFLNTQKEYSDPVTFIKGSCIHDRLLQELKHDDDLPLDCDIEGDLCLTGGLTVCPRSIADLPSGVIKRDVPFNERERITDYGTETTTLPPESTAPTSSTTVNREPIDLSKVKVTKISALAARRRQKMKKNGIEIYFAPFAGSKIIDKEQGSTLYHALPFKATPKTHMLFSTQRDGKSIKLMHNLIDNLGITLVLIKRDDFVFGGFAGTKWNHNGENFGQPNGCFLFSLNRDAIVPYRPSIEEPCVLFAEEDTLTFGRYDLVLADNFKQCVAVIENSYGIGLPPDSPEAEEYLAGTPEFAADVVEVWGFFSD